MTSSINALRCRWRRMRSDRRRTICCCCCCRCFAAFLNISLAVGFTVWSLRGVWLSLVPRYRQILSRASNDRLIDRLFDRQPTSLRLNRWHLNHRLNSSYLTVSAAWKEELIFFARSRRVMHDRPLRRPTITYVYRPKFHLLALRFCNYSYLRPIYSRPILKCIPLLQT